MARNSNHPPDPFDDIDSEPPPKKRLASHKKSYVWIAVILGVAFLGLLAYGFVAGDKKDFAEVSKDGKFDFAANQGKTFEANAIVANSRNYGTHSWVYVITDTGVYVSLYNNNHDGHAPRETQRIKVKFRVERIQMDTGATHDGRLLKWRARED